MRVSFEKRAYLTETGRRRPTEPMLRRLLDRVSLLRYNELFLYSGREPARLDPVFAGYAKMKGVEVVALDAGGLAAIRGEGAAEVSTEAPRSLAGRVEEMRERMEAAEARGREKGVKRFLVTDFSDGLDWHSPIVSLPGMVMGGYFASIGAKAAKMDLERELSQFLDAPMAGTLLKLGTLYLRGGARRDDSSEYFNILSNDRGYSRHPGITDFVLNEVSSILRGIMADAERSLSRSETAKDILYTALLLDAACNRRNEARLKTAREEFVRMWNRHFEPGGRDMSVAKFPRF